MKNDKYSKFKSKNLDSSNSEFCSLFTVHGSRYASHASRFILYGLMLLSFLLLNVTVAFNLADAACTRNYPSVHFTPTSGIVSAGAAKAYTVTITNNDKEDTPGDCGASTFALSISSETGDIGSFVIPSTLGSGTTGSLAVAGRYNTTLTVTAAGTITEGHKLTSIVQAVDDINHSGKTGKGSVVTKASAYTGEGMILRRAEEEICHACHKTDRNRTPSDSDWNEAIKTHNSVLLGSSKWSASGGWGVAGGKYGEFVCTTCHTAHSTANIYVIKETITTPDGSNFQGRATNQATVDFRYKEAYDPANPKVGVMGMENEDRTVLPDPKTTRVCEACHTYDVTQAQGVYVHAYNMPAVSHNGTTACTDCHSHKTGFAGGGCNSCHGYPPVVDTPTSPNGLVWVAPTTGSGTAGKHSFHATAAGRNYACDVCHYQNRDQNKHNKDPRVITLGFYMFDGAYQGGGYDGQVLDPANYDATTTSPATTVTETGTKRCSNIYCHGRPYIGAAWEDLGGGSDTSPAWDVTPACGTCHGASAASPPTRGSHTKHTGSAGGGRQLPCSDCHNTYTPAAIPSGMATHVNNLGEFSFDTSKNYIGSDASYNGTTTMFDAYGSCSSLYCHSNAQTSPPGGALTYRTPTWGGSVGCDATSCHGGNTDPNKITTGSHTEHITTGTYNFACSNCHSGAGDGTALHANYEVNVAMATGTYDGTPPPGDAYGSCTDVYCHSQGTSNSSPFPAPNVAAAWNTTFADLCVSCHSGDASKANIMATNRHGAHVNNASAVGELIGCKECHRATVSGDTTIDTYSRHVNRLINVSVDNDINNLDSDTPTYAGLDARLAVGGMTKTPGTAVGNCTNFYCHSTGNLGVGSNLTFRTIAWDAVAIGCDGCHGDQAGKAHPVYANGGAGDVNANSHPAHVDGGKTCDICHIETTEDVSLPPTTVRTDLSPTRHINRVENVTFNTSKAGASAIWTAGTKTCSNLACHGDVQWGGPPMDCVTCHGAALGNRRQITGAGGDFVRASRHVSNGTTTEIVTKWDCVVCHLEGQATGNPGGTSADHTGTPSSNADVNLRNVDDYAGTGWVWNRFTIAGLPAADQTIMRNNMDRFCLSCHDSDTSADTNVTMTASGSGAQSWTPSSSTIGYLNLLTNDADTTYYWTTTNNAYHTNAIHDISSSVSGTVDSVTVYGVCRGEAAGNKMRLALRIGGTNYDGATNNSLTTSYATYSQTWATNPAGGSWTWTAINGMEAGFKSTTIATGQRCTQLYIVVSASGTNFDIGTGTKLVWGSNLGGASTIAVNGTNDGLLTGTAVARRFTPFNTSDNQQNAKEVDTDIRTARANSGVKDIRGMFNSQSLVGKGWASHHNLNIFEKRYSARNATAWPDAAWTTWTTREGQSIRTAGESAGLHCSDCHLNEINAHGSATTYYMLSNNEGNDTGFTYVGTTTSTDICSKCHANTTYGEGNNSTASRTKSHNQSGNKCSNISNADNKGLATLGSTTQITNESGRTDLTCLGCHGGITFGGIHGQNNAYQPGKADASVPTYRFMGTGGSMRWYSPNKATNPRDADWESSTTTPGCYTIKAVDSFGGCTKHDGFDSDKAVNRGRPLQY